MALDRKWTKSYSRVESASFFQIWLNLLNQLLTNDCLLRAYLIRPVAVLGICVVPFLPMFFFSDSSRWSGHTYFVEELVSPV